MMSQSPLLEPGWALWQLWQQIMTEVMLCLRTLAASTSCLWEPWLTCGALSHPIRGLTALLERPGGEALRPREDSEGSDKAQPSSHPCQGAHHVGKPSWTLQTRPNASLTPPRNPSPKSRLISPILRIFYLSFEITFFFFYCCSNTIA